MSSVNRHFSQPSPYLGKQSKIVNDEHQIRGSPEEYPGDFEQCLSTVGDIMKYAASKNATEACFGHREDFESNASWISYKEALQNATRIGSALALLHGDLGCENKNVGICCRNYPEFVYVHLGCALHGLTLVPFYSNFGADTIEHIFEKTRLHILFCDTTHTAERYLNKFRQQIKHIIVIKASGEEFERFSAENSGNVKINSFAELEIYGTQQPQTEPKLDPECPMVIFFTSGTTGTPKGVVHTHRSFIMGVLTAYHALAKNQLTLNEHLHLSFLPMTQIMELIALFASLLHGYRIAFITKDPTELLKDLSYYKPTLLFTVPRLLERFYEEAQKRVRRNFPARWMLNKTIHKKVKQQERGIYRKDSLCDRLIFNQFRAKFGGRLENIICGGAPLRVEVLHFTKAAFSCPVLQAYGCTEAGGAVSSTFQCDSSSGHVGSILPGIKVKIVDVPSLGYVVKECGLGEICVSSPSCAIGYYENEELTQEQFDSDGFFHTGDIGMWAKNGCLRIVGRCKSMFKLSQGEYISPDELECIYRQSPLIMHIFIDGNPKCKQPVAIVVPNTEEILKLYGSSLVEEIGESAFQSRVSVSIQAMCDSVRVKKLLIAELNKISENNKLKLCETIAAIHLYNEPFSVDTGLLTPTTKLARHRARNYFAPIINKLCMELGK